MTPGVPLRGQKSVGVIRSACRARTKKSISSDMLACVMRRRSLRSALGAPVELVVELFDDRLLEDPLAARLAFRAAEHHAPVAGPLFAPVQRVDELPRAVKADVQLLDCR